MAKKEPILDMRKQEVEKVLDGVMQEGDETPMEENNDSPEKTHEPPKSGSKGNDKPKVDMKVESTDNSFSTDAVNVFNNSAEVEALTNPEIVGSITCYLDTEYLKLFRHLNTTWNEGCTATLIALKSLHLTIKYHTAYCKYFVMKGNEYSETTLKELNEALKKSAGFPCANLWIKGQPIMNRDLKTLLACHGSKIMGLTWDCWVYKEKDLIVLKQILFEYAPNIESLCFDSTYSSESYDSFQNVEFNSAQLSNLKSVRLVSCLPDDFTLRGIFQAAVNIEEFSSSEGQQQQQSRLVKFVEARVLITSKKSHLIHGIRGHLYSHNVELYEVVSNSDPPVKLEEFVLTLGDGLGSVDNRTETASALQEIFTSSSSSMEKLYIDSRIYTVLSKLVIPPMEKLTTVVVYCHTVPESRIIQPNRRLSVSFPALTHVCLNFPNDVTWILEYRRFLPFVDTVPTVQSVEISWLPNPDWLVPFSKLFPNVKTLSIKKIDSFPVVGRYIWAHFKGIQTLHLEILFGNGCPHNRAPIVDAVFTGFSQDTVRQLLNTNLKQSGNVMAQHRAHSSIMDLKELTKLGLTHWIIQKRMRGTETTITERCLTAVTTKYALDLMPNLQLTVTEIPQVVNG